MICPKCQRMRLIEGACVGCGYGFKRVRMPQRSASKGKKRPAKKPVKEPWWAR